MYTLAYPIVWGYELCEGPVPSFISGVVSLGLFSYKTFKTLVLNIKCQDVSCTKFLIVIPLHIFQIINIISTQRTLMQTSEWVVLEKIHTPPHRGN